MKIFVILGQGRSVRDIHGIHLSTIKDKYKIAAVVDPIEGRRIKAQKVHITVKK